MKRIFVLGLLLASALGCSREDLSREDVRKKVGQLFLLAFSGEDPKVVFPFIEERGIGGLYLSNENLKSPKKAALLMNKLQEKALAGISKQPLLTAADQEGAWAVMVPHSTSGPGNMALGCSDPENTFEMYSIFSEELSSVGVFCNLAPVSDVNSNPNNPIIGTRSFGEIPEQVALRVSEAIRGLHKNGVIATAKHFPGHGDTDADSHRGIPRVSRSLEGIEKVDLLPFKAAVNSGVDMVMTAHIIYDALDEEFPATLSRKILSEYLREKMGFKGVIITDSFNMQAIQKNYDPIQAAVNAILAGADMIMLAEERYGEEVSDYVKSQMKLLDGVEKAVIEGEIPMERINESYNRIIALKNKYHLAERIPLNIENAIKSVGSLKNKQKAISIAEKALIVVYDKHKSIPLPRGSKVAIVKLSKENVEEIIRIGEGIGPNYANAYADFLNEMKESGFRTSEYAYDDPKISISRIIAVSEDYPFPGKTLDVEEQHRRLEILRKNNPEATIIDVALRNPYDAYTVEKYVDAYVTSSGANISNIKAVTNLISGKLKATGTLSVTPDK